MSQVVIVNKGLSPNKKFPHFVLMAPLKEGLAAQSVASSENSKTSQGLYAYAKIHCVRLGLDHFWDGNKKVELESLGRDARRSAQMEPGSWQ